MQIKIKAFSLLLIAAAGLLLGGNVSAAGIANSSISVDDASALVAQLRQKVSDLAQQLQSVRNQPVATVTIVNTPVLTQEKLDSVQIGVNRIAGEVAQLKIKVAVYVILREIQQKTTVLNSQINPAASFIASVPANQFAAAAVSADKRQEVEAQIAKIKQQIVELSQEMAVTRQTGKQSDAPVVSSNGETCQGGTCSVSGTQNGQSAAPVAVKTTETPKKGFWQSIGDFFKKLFSF